MSWDIDLTDDRGHQEGSWNYTHNCNKMIADAMRSLSITVPDRGTHPIMNVIGDPWWKHLDGMTGPDGAAFLTAICDQLRKEPARFIAMNPPNGWGSYDSLLSVLDEMRTAVPEWPCSWEASG